ncbi:MAG TPA: hypothetical protein VFI65_32725 [Streptosporangiaceae bacterium]|nr:hypothetical protein [Streptosporangiaceae bacterium]
MRQRLLVIALVLAVAIFGSVLEGPRIFSSGSDTRDRRQPPAEQSPGQRAAYAARTDAAIWIHHWVAANADLACDPTMCQTLSAHGISGARLLNLSTSATDPLGADIVVATLTLRVQFGRRLAEVYAPAVLASFGKGDAEVDIRVVGDGSAYLRALRSDVAARKLAGTELLHNPEISAKGLAARELATGQVDSRLLTNLAAMARWACPLTVLSFGGRGPRSTAGMPLLSADITPQLDGPGMRMASARPDDEIAREVHRIDLFLNSQITPLRPASFAPARGALGRLTVQVNFTAPAQFGVFDGTPVETNPISSP